MLPDLTGAAQLCASSNPAAGILYITYEFGRDADQSQHSSLRPHW
jgi:hypothetical protein